MAHGRPWYKWRGSVQITLQGALLLEVLRTDKKLYGCVGTKEAEDGECVLYNRQGEEDGKIYFKCKNVANCVVQTPSFLEENTL